LYAKGLGAAEAGRKNITHDLYTKGGDITAGSGRGVAGRKNISGTPRQRDPKELGGGLPRSFFCQPRLSHCL